MSSLLYMPNREYSRLHTGAGGGVDVNILDFGAIDMCDEIIVNEEEEQEESFEIVQINDFTSEEIKVS